jgi:hypothetical protein
MSGMTEVRLLDDLLLAAVTGQEREVSGWIAERERAVHQFIRERQNLEDVEELQERTNRLTDRFLHWRRTSIMELSLIEQHLRFLREQEPDSTIPFPVRINVSA